MTKEPKEMNREELEAELIQLREYENETLYRVTTYDVDSFLEDEEDAEAVYTNVTNNFSSMEELSYFVSHSLDYLKQYEEESSE